MRSLAARLLATLLFCLYGMGGTSVSSGLFLCLAELGGEHEIHVDSTLEGSFQIVLHHRESAFTPRLRDHHCALDQVLTVLCSGSESGDHVFSQACSSVVDKKDEVERIASSKWMFNSVAEIATTSERGWDETSWRLVQCMVGHEGDHAPWDLRPRDGLGGIVLVI